MSGVEIVGIILGLYPFIVTLAETYKNMRGGGSKNLSNKVIIASAEYEQTVRGILASVMPEEDVQRLVEAVDQDQTVWQDAELRKKLSDRLGVNKVKVALEYMADMKRQLDGMKTDLDNLCHGTEILSRIKGKVRLVRASLPQSGIEDRVKKVSKLNGDLRTLLDERPFITPFPFQQARRPSLQVPAVNISIHKNSHQEALDFYQAIQAVYTCHCENAHLASLGCHCAACLQVSAPSVAPPPHEWKFGLFIQSNADTRTAVLLEPVSEHDGDGATIEDLCSLINDVAKAPLEEVRDIVSCNKRYKMMVRRADTIKKGNRMDEEMGSKISNPKTDGVKRFADLMPPNSRLSIKARLELALRLSSAIIYLRKTPWIDASWKWDDIYVGLGQDTEGFDVVEFTILFTPHEFYSVAYSADSASILTAVNDNLSLFHIIVDEPVLTRLGFALIELALSKTMEELRDELRDEHGFNESGINYDIINMAVAKVLLRTNRIRGETGILYENAVKACIWHTYYADDGLRELKLDHEEFPMNMNNAIISPLLDVWRMFGGPTTTMVC